MVRSPDRLPEWIRVPLPSARYPEVRSTVDDLRLTTVCREAHCPNKGECWSAGTATFMLLGADCTRRCSFCAVSTHWPNGVVDPTEPARVAEGIARWGLRYAVLTQVCRDDLPDGGAAHLAAAVDAIRDRCPTTRVELLIGDLRADPKALRTVLERPPDVLSHNLETVRRLSPEVRDRRAAYETSLRTLSLARELGPPKLVTKSSLMLGLGESTSEVREGLRDLRRSGVDLVTMGQYLRPSAAHRPVDRYLTPSEFDRLGALALEEGFAGAEAGPLVRSSYHAEALYERATTTRGA
jgi:lipoic acid synthetase